ncbi:MAG TPA: BON domain-containing protein, partial [Pirellulaceae bacterium]|nr:BON domain-containing protein [Pirellulaceae bacterium]
AEPFAPKSDDQDDLGRRVSNFLRSRHFDSFQDLNIEVHDGAVVVSGKLENYHEKQVALSCCQRVAGVITLVDKIKVTKPTS